jgi:hypothetical protein
MVIYVIYNEICFFWYFFPIFLPHNGERKLVCIVCGVLVPAINPQICTKSQYNGRAPFPAS